MHLEQVIQSEAILLLCPNAGSGCDELEAVAPARQPFAIEVDPARIIESMPTKDGGFDAMRRLLSMKKRPTAVVCFNDVVAIGAMLAIGR